MEGGLGNQLFQYALYRQLQFMGRTVKMDVTTEYGREHDRQQMLWAFDVHYEEATQEEINRLTDGFMDLPSRIRRKLTGRRTKKYAEADSNFDPQVLLKTPVYLTGYFQSEKYFKDVEGILHTELGFSDRIYDGISEVFADQIRNYQKQIRETESDYMEKSKEVLANGQETEGAKYQGKVLGWKKKLYYGMLRIIIRPLRQLL